VKLIEYGKKGPGDRFPDPFFLIIKVNNKIKNYILKVINSKELRTGTEFIMSATFTHLAEEKTFEQRIKGADFVQVMDKDHMYIGFYASRNAKMTIENANLTLSEANTVSPAEPSPVSPSMNIVSAQESSSSISSMCILR
jgi:hypothetical protein